MSEREYRPRTISQGVNIGTPSIIWVAVGHAVMIESLLLAVDGENLVCNR